MIKHIVMWKFKDEAEGKGKEENINIVKGLLEALPAVIPEIKSMETGIDVSHTASSADFCLVTEFANLADLKIYVEHPEHIKVGVYVRKVVATRTAIDFEI